MVVSSRFWRLGWLVPTEEGLRVGFQDPTVIFKIQWLFKIRQLMDRWRLKLNFDGRWTNGFRRLTDRQRLMNDGQMVTEVFFDG